MGKILKFPSQKVVDQYSKDIHKYHDFVDFLIYFQNNLAVDILPTNKDGTVDWTKVTVNQILTDSIVTIVKRPTPEENNEISIRFR